LLLLASAATAYGQSPKDYSAGCTSSGCHDGYQKAPVVHQPVKNEACDDCHKLADEKAHKFEFVAKGAQLCFECHDEPEGKVAHQPVGQGNCGACHNPHASKTKGLLIADSPAELCAECHDSVTEDLKNIHGPVAAGACMQCHAPHASDHAKLLSKPLRQLCLDCHTSMGERLADSKSLHAAVKESCGDCHNPHGGDDAKFVKDSLPNLCFECHDDVAEAMVDAAVKHRPVVEGASCAACHDAHASEHGHLLVNEPMTMCLSCHNREVTTNDGRRVANIGEMIKDRPQQHGPVGDGNCTACHAPHAGEFAGLLKLAFPATFYVPFAEDRYALCFDCHEVDAMLEAETDDLTAFRNGKQNLHYVHVNKERKGRVCRVCHEVHASNAPKLIAESATFGSWSLPIGFRPTETGGSCGCGCHRPYRYDRENRVANVPE